MKYRKRGLIRPVISGGDACDLCYRVPGSNLGWNTILKEFSLVPPRNIQGTVSIRPQPFVSEFLQFNIFR